MKKVLITGANKGIGFETSKQLAQLGYHVYMGSRDKANGIEAVNKLNKLGLHHVDCIQIDITDIASVKAARAELENTISSLDILINNAGIAGKQPQNFSSVDMENLHEVFQANFFGAVQTTQQFLELLGKSDEPRIVNVSSRLASLTFQTHSESENHRIYDAYSSSKTALNAFTVMLARELKSKNFRINCVEPGFTATDLNQFAGTQTTEQAAQAIIRGVTINATGKFLERTEGELLW